MKEPLTGNKLIGISVIVLCCVIILGWIILFTIVLLQRLFPKSELVLENVLQKISEPIKTIQKNSFYCIIFLIVIRFIAGWFGWAT